MILASRVGAGVALVVGGMLLTAAGRAAEASAPDACAPSSVLAPPRDTGVIALTPHAARGRCEVNVGADKAGALQRQLQLMEVIITAVCGARPEVRPGLPGGFTATLRLPASCTGKTATAVFEQDPAVWQPPPRPAPHYPPAAAYEELQGRVWVSMIVDAQGQVAAAILSGSSGHAVLDEAATMEVRSWRFTLRDPRRAPGTLTLMRVPITYLLD